MGVPSSRLEINDAFKKVPDHAGINSREALGKILCDHRESGAPFKQSFPGEKDVAVYKGGFTGGLLGRPGWELQALKTVTLKSSEQEASRSSH